MVVVVMMMMIVVVVVEGFVSSGCCVLLGSRVLHLSHQGANMQTFLSFRMTTVMRMFMMSITRVIMNASLIKIHVETLMISISDGDKVEVGGNGNGKRYYIIFLDFDGNHPYPKHIYMDNLEFIISEKIWDFSDIFCAGEGRGG